MNRVIWISFAAALAGCATTGARRSEPAPVEPVSAPAPEPAVTASPPLVANKKRTTAARPALPVKKVGPARQRKDPQVLPLENSLRKFQAVRMTFPKRRQAEMPLDVEKRWRWILDEVDTAVADEGQDGRESEELSVLMRAHLTVETEFQLDQRRYKEVDAELKTQVKETSRGLDQRVRLLRSLGTGFALHERIPHTGNLTLKYPVQLVNITSYFGRRRDPINRRQSRFHAGVDLGGPNGALIMSAGPGVVAHADWQGGGGNHIIVVHPNGYRTHYSHLSRILVEQGTLVNAGTPLGLMGETGRATGPHLHFSVSRHGSFLDPLEVLDVPLGPDGPAVPRS